MQHPTLDTVDVKVAKIKTGYRIAVIYVSPTTNKPKSKAFTLSMSNDHKYASVWNPAVVLGAARRVFMSLRPEDINRRYTPRGLSSLLRNFLRTISRRKSSKHLLSKYETEGLGPDPLLVHNSARTPSIKVPSNTGAAEGSHPLERTVTSNADIELNALSDLQRISINLPDAKSAFLPENTGVTYAIIGKSFSGKTTFIVRELNKLNHHQLVAYNAILFFTESTSAEPLKELNGDVRKRMIVMDRFCPRVLQAIKKINNETKNKFKFLVIFDDIIDLRGNLLTKSILTLRNANISTIISIQYEKLLNPAQRSSVHNMYIFNLRSPSWEYMLKGFLMGEVTNKLQSVKDAKPPLKAARLSQLLNEVMPKFILFYDQRRDITTFYKKNIQ